MASAMNKTFTPELDAGVLRRLEEYAAHFAEDFNRPRQRAWCGVYLAGLLQDGERKSIEPLSRRVTLPAALAGTSDPDQGLQQFVSQSTWDEHAVGAHYRALLANTFADPAGVFVLDDTTFPKAGTHSVGVQRQYCGALGKKASCQAAVSLHYVGRAGHVPLGLRLFLPESWLEDPARLDKAGVPEGVRRPLSKGEIALELLDARARGRASLPGQVVVGDSGYGVSGPLRAGLAARGLRYVLGVTAEMVVFTEEPRWQALGPRGGGRPHARPRLVEGSATRAEPACGRRADAAAQGHLARRHQRAAERPLRVGARVACPGLGGGRLRPRGTDLAAHRRAGRRHAQVRLQQPAAKHLPAPSGALLAPTLEDRTGLPADEGGTGPGPLRGPKLAWLPSSRGVGDARLWLPGARTTPRQGQARIEKKPAAPPGLITLPAIRRGLQHLLAPVAKPDCPYCRLHLLSNQLTE